MSLTLRALRMSPIRELRSTGQRQRETRPGRANAWRRSGLLGRAVALAVGLALALGAGDVEAVLIGSGDGQGNLEPPREDPGWHHVGTRARNGMSLIYLGDGWVLTANHVGAEDVRLGGVVYRVLANSARRILNHDATPTDLLLYRIRGNPSLPPLPRLQIARSTPPLGEPVLMIGYGCNRGAAVLREVAPGRWVQGWKWGEGTSLRWGTNRVASSGTRVALRKSFTQAIATEFEPPPNGTVFEAQAARGDSGGAVFAAARSSENISASDSELARPRRESGREWELVGVMFAVASTLDRKDDVSVFGGYTYSIDLAHYRDQIMSIVDAAQAGQPEVPTGEVPLPAGRAGPGSPRLP